MHVTLQKKTTKLIAYNCVYLGCHFEKQIYVVSAKGLRFNKKNSSLTARINKVCGGKRPSPGYEKLNFVHSIHNKIA
jgi:hypothetical protein